MILEFFKDRACVFFITVLPGCNSAPIAQVMPRKRILGNVLKAFDHRGNVVNSLFEKDDLGSDRTCELQ